MGFNLEDELSSVQKRAVDIINGNGRVIAGAGSGKTRVLTYRYISLVEEYDIDPDVICCITFTNKAANEMKKRIQEKLGYNSYKYICTFHSLGNKIIREEINKLKGWTKSYDILSEGDIESVLSRIYKTIGITIKELSFEEARRSISKLKNSEKRDEYIRVLCGFVSYTDRIKALSSVESAQRDYAEEVTLRYITEQRTKSCLDFEDLVAIPLFLFDEYPDVRKKWSNKFEYVMVDEFQDVSRNNYELCEVISSGCKCLYIVGDPDQSIYGWRGSRVEYIIDFHKEHDINGDSDISLMRNYRSSEAIVNVANALIKHNRVHKPSDMEVSDDKKHKPKVMYYHAKTLDEEKSEVTKRICDLMGKGVDLSEIAILSRRHKDFDSFATKLKRENIHYRYSTGTPFYERTETRVVMAYLKLILDFADEDDFELAIMNPGCGIGYDELDIIFQTSNREGISLFDAFKRIIETKGEQNPKACSFVHTIERSREMVNDNCKIAEVLDFVFEDSGIKEHYSKYSYESRLESLKKMQDIASRHDESPNGYSINQYISDIESGAAIATEEKAVTLSTVHAAKGLEFKYVFIIRMNEGLFPSSQITNLDDMEEERRVAYVAITRAEEELYIFEDEKTDEKSLQHSPSRFIFELDENWVEDISKTPISQSDKDALREEYAFKENQLHAAEQADKIRAILHPGQKVQHKFGIGIIHKITDNGKIIVHFLGGIGKKTLTSDSKITVLTDTEDNSSCDAESTEDNDPGPNDAIVEESVINSNQITDHQTSTFFRVLDKIEESASYQFTVEEKCYGTHNDDEIETRQITVRPIHVLPFPCGVGKSTAIGIKLKKVIESLSSDGSGDGIIVTTDRIDSLENYLDSIIPEVKAFLFRNLDKITILESSNLEEAFITMKQRPILLMTTQRLLQLNHEEIEKKFLQWNNGRRTLILIDEAIPLKQIYELGIDEISAINGAVQKTIVSEDDDCKKFIELWNSIYEKLTKHLRDKATTNQANNKHSEVLYYRYQCIPDDETDKRINRVLTKYEGDLSKYRPSNKGKQILNIYGMLHALLNGIFYGCIYDYLCFSGKVTRNCLVCLSDRTDTLLSLSASVVMLNATAMPDLPEFTAAYSRFKFHFEDVSDFTRTMPNLTVEVYRAENTTKTSSHRRTAIRSIVDKIKRHLSGITDYVVFTHKEAEKAYSEEFGADHVNHFGNITGSNEYIRYDHIVQIGLNEQPPSHYMLQAMYEHNHAIKKADGFTPLEFKEGKDLTSFMNSSDEILRMKNAMLLADTMQNIMRGSIRTTHTEQRSYTYYLFVPKDKNHDSFVEYLRQYIESDSIGGHVNIHELDSMDMNDKSKARAPANGKTATKPQLFINWHDQLEEGTSYTAKQIREAMQLTETERPQNYAAKGSEFERILSDERIKNGVYKKGHKRESEQ